MALPRTGLSTEPPQLVTVKPLACGAIPRENLRRPDISAE